MLYCYYSVASITSREIRSLEHPAIYSINVFTSEYNPKCVVCCCGRKNIFFFDEFSKQTQNDGCFFWRSVCCCITQSESKRARSVIGAYTVTRQLYYMRYLYREFKYLLTIIKFYGQSLKAVTVTQSDRRFNIADYQSAV